MVYLEGRKRYFENMFQCRNLNVFEFELGLKKTGLFEKKINVGNRSRLLGTDLNGTSSGPTNFPHNGKYVFVSEGFANDKNSHTFHAVCSSGAQSTLS